ncbi:hypothetical protein [Nakamurella endophytica]|uniref:Intracellular septation protein A n=1 Tax=Nakamurella endophytica TaxID=1748367 RepID=A0A917TD66_9ACTN|nr:hypothetical protein [Nakamurella endophytica]GGM19088.1 hypothetical protein GCM10011594_43940 [Nakamurella endophytica]
MAVLLAFAPWIAYWVLASNNTFETGAAVALAVAVVLGGWDLLHHRRPKTMDVATLVWFLALSAVGLAIDDRTLAQWSYATSNLFLAVVAAVTILTGRPFTLAYAEEGATPEERASPGFRRATAVIAWVWTAAFVVMFASSLLSIAQPGWSTWTDWVVPIGALVLAMKFTGWYPEYLGRQAAAEPALR